MKKFLFVVIIMSVAAGGAFAQADSNTHWVSGEVSLLGIGARYEYMLTPNFSVGAHMYASTLIIWNNTGISAVGRYYPWGNIFFGELALGFGYNSGVRDYEYKYEDGSWGYWLHGSGVRKGNDWVGITGFLVAPAVGWKIDVGNKGGFFLQPGVKVPIVIGKKKPIIDWWGDDVMLSGSKVGIGAGFLPYLGMGYAF